jgi:hypothetical protein
MFVRERRLLMKSILVALMLLAFSGAVIGCEANAKVGDTDDVHTTRKTTTYDSGGTYEKKTTTVREPDGDVKTKTEIRSNP